MGQKSTKENKNIYQLCREEAGLTRAAASEKMEYISASRIEKIENGQPPYPDEIVTMAECYLKPALCNHYCSKECEIGKIFVPEVIAKSLPQITLEMLVNINTLSQEKDRLMEITVDGKIEEKEMADFVRIQKDLEELSLAVDALQLWVSNTINEGSFNKELYEKEKADEA